MFNYRDVLDTDGLIARGRPHYERRDAQLAMAAEVTAAIRDKRLLTIEAGTGVGKSFAYLVPAILYAVADQVRDFSIERGDLDVLDEPSENRTERAVLEDGTILESNVDETPRRVLSSLFGSTDADPDGLRRVVVSTHTISLQEQLFEKDIPFLNSILPFEFTAALAKGRSNYLCLRRFAYAKKSAATENRLFETQEQQELVRIGEWVKKTRDGSKSELTLNPSFGVWDEICCEQGNCLYRACPHYDRCFYYKARRRLESAQIIVVNHALLFSDLALRQGGFGILPNYDVLIFDEAHTMEQVAADHMGSQLTYLAVDRLLVRLYNERNNRGLLVEEASKVFSSDERKSFDDAKKLVDDCRGRAGVFFEELNDWLEDRPGSTGRVLDKNIIRNTLSEGLTHLSVQLRRCADFIEDPGRRQEYISARSKIEGFVDAVDNWIEQREEGFVYWLERTVWRGKPRIAMCSAPVDVAPILRAKLFNVIPTVVATSATLSTLTQRPKNSAGLRKDAVQESAEADKIELDAIAAEPDEESAETKKAFEFFRGRVGLTGSRARALGSPFDFYNQMTLVLARGLELNEHELRARSRNGSQRANYNERRLFAALQDYIEETQGGAFVLFTNAAQMKRASEALAPWFAEKNYPYFSQSEGTPRQRMVQKFKESSNSVLFGVDSFWQGVDVPGAALRNVIIVKLPFLSPGQPLIEARQELIKERGGSPFRDYLLPTAILKFKQGVGRLIRTKNDSGQVVVLDERVHTKSYGRDFLRALPDCKLRVDIFE